MTKKEVHITANSPLFQGERATREEVEAAVSRRLAGKRAPNLVVSIKTYSEVERLAKKLENAGIMTTITQGGVGIAIQSIDQLEPMYVILREMDLKPQLGVTDAELGSERIKKLKAIGA